LISVYCSGFFFLLNAIFSANLVIEQACQYCPITRRERAVPSTSYPRTDTLAAQRIMPNCSGRCKIYLQIKRLCNCTEYLMNPLHSCKTDGNHLCRRCFDKTKRGLELENIWVTYQDGHIESFVGADTKIKTFYAQKANYSHRNMGVSAMLQSIPRCLCIAISVLSIVNHIL
jgi:hypothetical protein